MGSFGITLHHSKFNIAPNQTVPNKLAHYKIRNALVAWHLFLGKSLAGRSRKLYKT